LFNAKDPLIIFFIEALIRWIYNQIFVHPSKQAKKYGIFFVLLLRCLSKKINKFFEYLGFELGIRAKSHKKL